MKADSTRKPQLSKITPSANTREEGTRDWWGALV